MTEGGAKWGCCKGGRWIQIKYLLNLWQQGVTDRGQVTFVYKRGKRSRTTVLFRPIVQGL